MNRSEIDDFKKALKKHGYFEDDFELNHKDLTQWDPPAVRFLNGTLTILCKSTNKEKTYSIGPGNHWVVDFEDDLINGDFE